jgi:hypothetical protein
MTNRTYSSTAVLLILSFGMTTGAAIAQTAQTTNSQPSTNPTLHGTVVDPIAGPQSPASTAVAGPTGTATSQSQDQQTLPDGPKPAVVPKAPEAQQSQGPQEPVGAATAEKGVTRGGVASRPAGAAIAPAKQRQTRSLLIKTGAILAGAAAIGTIYALTRGTSSKPPGASLATTGR